MVMVLAKSIMEKEGKLDGRDRIESERGPRAKVLKKEYGV